MHTEIIKLHGESSCEQGTGIFCYRVPRQQSRVFIYMQSEVEEFGKQQHQSGGSTVIGCPAHISSKISPLSSFVGIQCIGFCMSNLANSAGKSEWLAELC